LKRLYSFSIRSFTGPFLVTFAISMFILIMQFFWKYIDDLMGKGIEITVILELLFFISASLIPLALPLSILLSSIMTLGNLSENNEITALKASGLSLYRIIKPLTVIILTIAFATFLFANYVIPVSNLKWHSIIFDIQNTKIATILTPGVYSNALDGYTIKIKEGEGNKFSDIIIHDHTSPTSINIKTIRAKNGEIYRSDDGKYIFFDLKDGIVIEELASSSPTYSDTGELSSAKNDRPSRRSSFDQATYKIDLSGFDMNKSKENMFKDKHEMLNVFQIYSTRDSIKKSSEGIVQNFLMSLKNDHPFFQSYSYNSTIKNRIDSTGNKMAVTISQSTIDTLIVYDKLSKYEKISAIQQAQTKLRNRKTQLNSQKSFLHSMENDLKGYMIEFHRKFALTFAIIILFFIGAPLGAIVRKGGFGAPVVIAALLFMVYFVLLSSGESLANSGTVSPFVGMWFPSLVLTPFAILLMRSAANDRSIFDFSRTKKKVPGKT